MTPKIEVKIPAGLYDTILTGINKYREAIRLTPLDRIREGRAAEPYNCPIACSLNEYTKDHTIYSRLYQNEFVDRESVMKFIDLIDECPDNTLTIPVRDES